MFAKESCFAISGLGRRPRGLARGGEQRYRRGVVIRFAMWELFDWARTGASCVAARVAPHPYRSPALSPGLTPQTFASFAHMLPAATHIHTASSLQLRPSLTQLWPRSAASLPTGRRQATSSQTWPAFRNMRATHVRYIAESSFRNDDRENSEGAGRVAPSLHHVY